MLKVKAETANRITANILKVVNFQNGCTAKRINNVGIWDAAKKVYRANNTEKGIADIFMLIRGRCIWVEVKAGKDRQSDHQKQFEQDIRRAGGEYWLIRSTDEFLQHFQNALK